MADPLERAQQLLAMCSSPEAGERATAALRLYEHAEKHGLVFVFEKEQRKAYTPPPPPPPPPPRPQPAYTSPPNWGKAWYTRPEPEHPKSHFTGKNGPRHMPSKYGGWCKGCKAAIDEGDDIVWTPSNGVYPGAYHPDCYPGVF